MMSARRRIGFRFIPFPIVFFDWLPRLNVAELKCYIVVLRQTYARGKPQDAIARSQFCEMAGLSRTSAVRALHSLKTRGLLRSTVSVKRPRIYEALTPRLLDIGRLTAEPTGTVGRITAEPTVGSPVRPTIESKSTGPRPVKTPRRRARRNP